MDFNDISDKVPVQEFDIPQDRNIAEYVVKYVDVFCLCAEKVLTATRTLQDGKV
jgi:hypothetical protein